MRPPADMCFNDKTKQFKRESLLTPREQKSGLWFKFESDYEYPRLPKTKQQLRRDAYMASVRLKHTLEECMSNPNFEEKIKYFDDFQNKIVSMHKEANEKTAKLHAEFEQRKGEIEKEFQTKDAEIWKDCNENREKYKAELKAWCGITDGERTNVLDLMKALRRVVDTESAS